MTRANDLHAFAVSRLTRGFVRRSSTGAALVLASCLDAVPEATLSAEPAAVPRGAAAVTSARDADRDADDFARDVVADLNSTWSRAFRKLGKSYTPLANGWLATSGECPAAKPEAPCPSDPTDIDLPFQRRLRDRYGEAAAAPQTYALAHHAGHHLQRLFGIDVKVREALAERPVARHSVQIQLELQADCFAGLWLRLSEQRALLTPADAERALRQASELGKERRLAQRQTGEPPGESFTYAMPRQRGYWFYQGYTQGKLEACDTFAVD